MIELLLPYGFDTLEYSWVKATIGICMLADYSVTKKRQHLRPFLSTFSSCPTSHPSIRWSTQGIVSVFCTGKIQGGQDHMFLFRDSLANYYTHYDLFWFRPLLGGNSSMSSGLILEMNRVYNGVSIKLKKFAMQRGK
jgi:hypothetical protein